MNPRLKFSLIITVGVLLLVSLAFFLTGAAEGLICVLPLVFVILFPIAYLIARALPLSDGASSGPSAPSELFDPLPADNESQISPADGAKIRRSNPTQVPLTDKRAWWIAITLAGIMFLVFAFAVWVWTSEISLIQIIIGVALMAGGLAQRSLNKNKKDAT